ncbi:unnamed protein product, partial [marine sediment metagenome]
NAIKYLNLLEERLIDRKDHHIESLEDIFKGDDILKSVKEVLKTISDLKTTVNEIKSNVLKELEKLKSKATDRTIEQKNLKVLVNPNLSKHKEEKLMEIRTEILRFNKLLELIEFFLSKYDNAEKYLRKRVKEHKEEDLKNKI